MRYKYEAARLQSFAACKHDFTIESRTIGLYKIITCFKLPLFILQPAQHNIAKLSTRLFYSMPEETTKRMYNITPMS